MGRKWGANNKIQGGKFKGEVKPMDRKQKSALRALF